MYPTWASLKCMMLVKEDRHTGCTLLVPINMTFWKDKTLGTENRSEVTRVWSWGKDTEYKATQETCLEGWKCSVSWCGGSYMIACSFQNSYNCAPKKGEFYCIINYAFINVTLRMTGNTTWLWQVKGNWGSHGEQFLRYSPKQEWDGGTFV